MKNNARALASPGSTRRIWLGEEQGLHGEHEASRRECPGEQASTTGHEGGAAGVSSSCRPLGSHCPASL